MGSGSLISFIILKSHPFECQSFLLSLIVLISLQYCHSLLTSWNVLLSFPYTSLSCFFYYISAFFFSFSFLRSCASTHPKNWYVSMTHPWPASHSSIHPRLFHSLLWLGFNTHICWWFLNAYPNPFLCLELLRCAYHCLLDTAIWMFPLAPLTQHICSPNHVLFPWSLIWLNNNFMHQNITINLPTVGIKFSFLCPKNQVT